MGSGQGPRAPLDAQPARDQLALEAELAQVGHPGGLLVDQQAGGTVRKAGLQRDLVGVELYLAGYGNDAEQPVMVDAGEGHPVGAGDRPHAVGGQAHHGPADVPPQHAAVTGKPEQEPGRGVLAQLLGPDHPVEPFPAVLDGHGGPASRLRPPGQQCHPLVPENRADLADQRERGGDHRLATVKVRGHRAGERAPAPADEAEHPDRRIFHGRQAGCTTHVLYRKLACG
ncbi:MAG TPA: hypothetical protein VJ305_24405 [Streptosporangiaceae bacterium]|nr:hypothetical protein [Streptosporangiaceae bacterium]